MEKILKNVNELKALEQVSDKSLNNVKDAFFACMKEERERRVSRFEQTMNPETFMRFNDALTLFDDIQDVSEDVLAERLEQYFDTLIGFLEMALDRQNRSDEDRSLYSQAVEELYLINCERIKKYNSYHIYNNHPILLMNERLNNETAEMLDKKKDKTHSQAEAMTSESTDYEILKSVFKAKIKNRRRMRIYGRNIVHEIKREKSDEEKEFAYAIPFRQSSECTEIPIIRIWEKIKNYKELHDDETDLINIAVFGNLKEYSDADKEVVEKLSGVTINCTSFRHEPMTGEYFFTNSEGEEIYDLMDMNDLQLLAEHYQIVIFLDMNCFYRQGQAEKDVEEKSVDTTCRWNFERSQRREQFKDKAAIYRTIYNRIGQWINSPDSNMSASFEFDERLYRNLAMLPKEKTDIYLYIRYGANIGGLSLSNNGICNDEYYGGISLTVCRLTNLDKERFNESYGMFLSNGGNDKKNEDNVEMASYVPIRFWKLFKSISNEYCDNVLHEFATGDTEKTRDIVEFLNESHLILFYSINSDEEKVRIQYKLEMAKKPKSMAEAAFCDLQETMANTVKVILKYAFGEEELYCMNRYFERLLIYSVISNADDVGDLIFAYWISSHWYTVEGRIEERRDAPEENAKEKSVSDIGFANSSNRFKVRKTVYSIVKRLANMRMRNVPNMEDLFSASFHGEVCPEITDENLDRTYRRISDYCELLNYTGGYLYSNSRVLMNK